jgi:hypothetical protein
MKDPSFLIFFIILTTIMSCECYLSENINRSVAVLLIQFSNLPELFQSERSIQSFEFDMERCGDQWMHTNETYILLLKLSVEEYLASCNATNVLLAGPISTTIRPNSDEISFTESYCVLDRYENVAASSYYHPSVTTSRIIFCIALWLCLLIYIISSTLHRSSSEQRFEPATAFCLWSILPLQCVVKLLVFSVLLFRCLPAPHLHIPVSATLSPDCSIPYHEITSLSLPLTSPSLTTPLVILSHLLTPYALSGISTTLCILFHFFFF